MKNDFIFSIKCINAIIHREIDMIDDTDKVHSNYFKHCRAD